MKTPDAYEHFLQRLDATPQATFHLGLEVMKQAVDEEGLSHPAPYVVIVAGTNGKGTVAASLSHLCSEHGLRTTLLTSPHLVEFRERIRIQGVPIEAEALAAIGNKLLPKYGAESQRSPRPLSYFELSVLHGLVAAREAQSDVLIMEVGLGGRLDATNVVESDLAVITSISLDHTDLLGSTLAEIVGEKAAVARPDRPVVHHARQGGFEELRQALTQIGARRTVIEGGDGAREQNLALAVTAFDYVLAHFGRSASPAWIASVLEDFQWPGRLSWEVDRRGRPVLLDGAHNAESAAELARYLEATEPGQRFEAVVALSAGRKAEDVLTPLVPYVSRWHICAPNFSRVNSAADTAKALCAFEEAQQQAGRASRPCAVYASVDEALRAAEESAAANGTKVLVFGSLYLVGEAYRYLGYGGARLPRFSKRAAQYTGAGDAAADAVRSEDKPTASSPPLQGLRAFLNGPWFPDGRLSEDTLARSQSRLPLVMPRSAVAATTFLTIVVMALTHVTLGSRMTLYAGLALGTVLGNLAVGIGVAKMLRMPIATQNLRIPTILSAVAMGAVFSLTAALMMGVLTELYSVLVAGTFLEEIWTKFLVTREESYEAMLSPTTGLSWVAALMTVAFLPGVCEEFLFRGVFYRMMDGVKAWRKIVFIGVLFGLIHFDPAGFVPLVVLGIVLTWLRALTGAWVVPAVVHISFNATALMMAMSPMMASMDMDTDESSLAWALVMLVLTFALSTYLFMRFARPRVASPAEMAVG